MINMTAKMATNRLKNLKDGMKRLRTADIKNSETYRNILALDKAIAAVEKEEPQKVHRIINLELGTANFCPNCEKNLHAITKRCPECGQVLDWKTTDTEVF